ncbi:MAG: PIN domain-containing protein [Allorhizobium sp.]|uniref:PIN domain-containing protein n=1 Tax=Allorhizobium sp. TaxID=633478 RepID=UPI0040331AFA
MIGVDTNVLVRFLVEDDPKQNALARDFFSKRSAEDPAFVSAIVLAETVWVLRRNLKLPLATVCDLIQNLLAADRLVVEFTEELDALLSQNTPQSDIADYLIAWSAKRAGCKAAVTFDRTSAEAIPGMELLA